MPPTASRLSLEAAVSARVAGIAVRHPEAVPREDRRDTVLLAPPGPPRVHWRVLGFPQDALDWIVSPRDALLQALTCLDEEDALACLDSAVHEGAVSPAEIAGVLARAPERLRPLQREMDPLADSGLETIVRRRLRRAGFSVRPQVHLPGIGWIDLLVEEILAIEIDGYEWHSSRERFHADVDRAVREQAFGLRTLRFGQRHVFEEWPLTLSAIERQVRER
ncbi:endonuclease domain-containing protein [Compostimonas suwonensis]|uniref:endonuclease domain-containing protein n=1 Tax=Compostimonas suwonensis TaxID=1048394 RepID=UPI0012FE163F|nr:hypothetical protein [Compostimonas suwonensis]